MRKGWIFVWAASQYSSHFLLVMSHYVTKHHSIPLIVQVKCVGWDFYINLYVTIVILCDLLLLHSAEIVYMSEVIGEVEWHVKRHLWLKSDTYLFLIISPRAWINFYIFISRWLQFAEQPVAVTHILFPFPFIHSSGFLPHLCSLPCSQSRGFFRGLFAYQSIYLSTYHGILSIYPFSHLSM